MRLNGIDVEELINVGINTFHLSRLPIYFISPFIGSSFLLALLLPGLYTLLTPTEMLNGHAEKSFIKTSFHAPN